MELGTISPRYRLRAKQRLAVLRYVQQHSLRGASLRFGLARGTIRVEYLDGERRFPILRMAA
jgi:hypothetical protein